MPEIRPGRVTRSLAGASLLVVLAGGCESEAPPTIPSTDLSGIWTLSYTTQAAGCSFPRGLRQECIGGGRLTLVHQGDTITGSIPLVGWCQSCMGIADAFGFQPSPMNGTADGGRLELRAFGNVCRLTADVGPGHVVDVEGQATCTFHDVTMTGTWRMSRTE